MSDLVERYNMEKERSSYHKSKITNGDFGKWTKIKEEFEEFEDALQQGNNLMSLLELSDMLGAIEEYIKQFNMTLSDLMIMKDATKRAFESGDRK